MRLDIDGRNCELESGRSILDAVKKEGLDSIMLSDRPLAAQIGGEVFNLRFTPKRIPRYIFSAMARIWADGFTNAHCSFCLFWPCARNFQGRGYA